MGEERDLYNINREKLGRIIAGDKVPDGQYYVTVIIFIQNDERQFLIQKRSDSKGGKWAFTGGHPKAGKSSKQGAIEEIHEELGIDMSEDYLKLFRTVTTEDDFVDLYYLRKNIDLEILNLQKEEVNQVKWATAEEIEEMVENKDFMDEHVPFFRTCLNYLAN